MLDAGCDGDAATKASNERVRVNVQYQTVRMPHFDCVSEIVYQMHKWKKLHIAAWR